MPPTEIRVAHILASMEIGGKERIVRDLCGPNDIVITFDAEAGRTQFPLEQGRRISLDRHRSQQAFYAAGKEALIAWGIHIVHAHGHIAPIYAQGFRSGTPLHTLATLHTGLGRDWQWFLPIRSALRKMDRLVAVSNDIARRFTRFSGMPVETIVPGIDVAPFRNLPARPRQTPFRIGMAARLHPVKRIHDAIAAVARLRREGADVELVIAGEGNSKPSVPADIQDRVSFLGPVADMAAFHASLNAFILCSKHEGTPLALIEAMAAGLPCIATRVGGIPDLVGAGDTASAILVPPRSPERIAEAVRMLLDHPDRAASLAKRARIRAEHYSLDRQITAYQALYAETIFAARRV